MAAKAARTSTYLHRVHSELASEIADMRRDFISIKEEVKLSGKHIELGAKHQIIRDHLRTTSSELESARAELVATKEELARLKNDQPYP